jgi:coenzyme Q-binding protein COQ10
MKHIERHYTRHTPTQLFDLVVDVEQYPKFLPWILGARVIRRLNDTLWVEMTIGAGFLRRRFMTVAVLERPRRMEIKGLDPMFEHFEQVWTFEPAADGGTDVEYRVDFRVKSRILEALVGASVTDRSRSMVQAYIREAQRLYGPQPA